MKKIFQVLWVPVLLLSGGIYAQNAPISTAGTVKTFVSTITVPVTARNFTNIGSCNLKLVYNPAVFNAVAVTAGPLLGGTVNSNLTVPGEVVLGWYIYPGKTLPDNSVIFNLVFSKVASAGNTAITWVDDGISCYYADGNNNVLNDTPTSAYYINGSVTTDTLNGIVEPGSFNDIVNNGTAKNPLKLSSYPDPFTDQSAFSFFLPVMGKITLEIRNLSGETVETVADTYLFAGDHCLKYSHNSLKPGIYVAVLVLQTNKEPITSTNKIICKRITY